MAPNQFICVTTKKKRVNLHKVLVAHVCEQRQLDVDQWPPVGAADTNRPPTATLGPMNNEPVGR